MKKTQQLAARIGWLIVLAFVLAVAAGCTPVQRSATDRRFYSTGQPNVEFRMVPTLTLASSGRILANVPSDTNLLPAAYTTYAIFGEGGEGLVSRHAHALFSSLPSNSWRWRMETWPLTYSLRLSKLRTAGQYWTVHMLPVAAEGDWFTEFWKLNGRETPRFWLAKRWSATPDNKEDRILAEYREPAPECMEEALLPLEAIVKKAEVSPPDSMQLWHLCRKEIEAFSTRADASVALDYFTGERQEQVVFKDGPRPQQRPNMKKLVGEAEVREFNRGDYNSNR